MINIIYYLICRCQGAEGLRAIRLFDVGLLITFLSFGSGPAYASSFVVQQTHRTDSLSRLNSLEDLRSRLYLAREAANLPEVKRILQELIRLQSSEKQEYLDLAYIYAYQSEYTEAVDLYQVIEQRFELSEDDHLVYGGLLVAKGDGAGAIAYIENVLTTQQPQKANRFYAALAEWNAQNGNWKAAFDWLEKGEAVAPSDPLIALTHANLLIDRGKLTDAFPYLQKVISTPQVELDAKAGLLYKLLEQGQIASDNLWELANTFVQQYPQVSRAWAATGDIAANLERLEDAKKFYMKALEIDQGTPLLWYQLLELLVYKGDFDDGIRLGKHAAKLFPRDAQILRLTGNAFYGKEEFDAARLYFEAGLNVVEENDVSLLTTLYTALGGVYNALEMYSVSDAAYSEAIALDSINVFALNNYAYYLALRGEKLDKAAEMSKRTIALNPGVATYEDTYAWILFQQGNYSEALVWIRKAVSRSKKPSPTLLEHYGDILFRNGHKRDALQQWRLASKELEAAGLPAEHLAKKIDEKSL